MEFDWHPAKNETIRASRGFRFEDAVGIFAGRVVSVEDTRRDYGETRMVAIDRAGDLFFTVVYTDRGETRWIIITAWLSNRKERARWLA